MKIKLEWKEFVDIAIQQLKEIHPTMKEETLTFMKKYSGYADGEAYEYPDYIEVEI